MTKDIHIVSSDKSTTLLKRATTCCDGYHQTIAGALLGSNEWKDWYKYASKNMLFDVDETETVDAMSDNHFKSFIQFVKSK